MLLVSKYLAGMGNGVCAAAILSRGLLAAVRRDHNGGTTAKTVLVRASGPSLVPFRVSGTLPDPELQLFAAGSSSVPVAASTGWGGSAQIAAASASAGAFSWGTSATPDSAILLTLPPGAYTAMVSGASGDGGVALIEVYDIP